MQSRSQILLCVLCVVKINYLYGFYLHLSHPNGICKVTTSNLMHIGVLVTNSTRCIRTFETLMSVWSLLFWEKICSLQQTQTLTLTLSVNAPQDMFNCTWICNFFSHESTGHIQENQCVEILLGQYLCFSLQPLCSRLVNSQLRFFIQSFGHVR